MAELETAPDAGLRDTRGEEVRDTRAEVEDAEVVAPETGGPDAADTTSSEALDAIDTSPEALDAASDEEAGDGSEVESDVAADASDGAPHVLDGGADADEDTADAEPDAGPVEVGDDASVEADSGDPDGASEVLEVSEDVADDVGPDAGPNLCNTVVATFPVDPSPHVETCSEVLYATNPPTSGPHYPVWAAFKTYTNPVSPGFFVHSMEHGGVVIQYRCDVAPCDDDLAALADLLAVRPADPACLEPLRARIIVTPSATLDVRFAASAWGASLRSDCFDLPALSAFIDTYYAMAPEDFCTDGVDLDLIETTSTLYCPP